MATQHLCVCRFICSGLLCLGSRCLDRLLIQPLLESTHSYSQLTLHIDILNTSSALALFMSWTGSYCSWRAELCVSASLAASMASTHCWQFPYTVADGHSLSGQCQMSLEHRVGTSSWESLTWRVMSLSCFIWGSVCPLGGCWGPGGNRISKGQMCLEDCGARSLLLATNVLSGTKGSTQCFLQSTVFMKLNSTWVRDVLMWTKQRTAQQVLVVNRTKPEQLGRDDAYSQK